MNVLHICAGQLTGGASRGAYWLHQGLTDLGVTSTIFTDSQTTFQDPRVYTVSGSKWRRGQSVARGQLDELLIRLYPNRTLRHISCSMTGVDFRTSEVYEDADVIHLHHVSGAFFNVKHLKNVKKPIVWTLRDMWPMTGGCHYSLGCEKFKTGCGSCVQLGSRHRVDLSTINLRRKEKYIPRSIKIVGISPWLSAQASVSRVLGNLDIDTIENAINTSQFAPIRKDLARSILGIRTNKKIVLTGAVNNQSAYKGFDKFLAALDHLDPAEYHLCFFGHVDRNLANRLGFESSIFGYLHDDVSLRTVYSCADVFVAPSVMEAFGKTIVEAMACQTPVVCFDATGPKDIVTHQHDGYKAVPFDPASLADGIAWVAQSPAHQELCQQARQTSVARFDCKIIAKKYISLYEQMLADHSM